MRQMGKQWIVQASLMCYMQTFGLCAIFSARRYHYSSLQVTRRSIPQISQHLSATLSATKLSWCPRTPSAECTRDSYSEVSIH
jgi:hypothetical protein